MVLAMLVPELGVSVPEVAAPVWSRLVAEEVRPEAPVGERILRILERMVTLFRMGPR